MLISDIMTTNVHCIQSGVTLAELQEIFAQVPYHHLLITASNADNTLIGVLSDRDVMQQTSPYMATEYESQVDTNNQNTPVSDFMSTQIITATKHSSINDAAALLLENSISCLPIVDDKNQVEGIITWRDLIRYYVYQSPMPVEEGY